MSELLHALLYSTLCFIAYFQKHSLDTPIVCSVWNRGYLLHVTDEETEAQIGKLQSPWCSSIIIKV